MKTSFPEQHWRMAYKECWQGLGWFHCHKAACVPYRSNCLQAMALHQGIRLGTGSTAAHLCGCLEVHIVNAHSSAAYHLQTPLAGLEHSPCNLQFPARQPSDASLLNFGEATPGRPAAEGLDQGELGATSRQSQSWPLNVLQQGYMAPTKVACHLIPER